MKLPVPSTCCCCFSLKTGTLVLGWLCLVCSCLNVFGVLKELAMMGELEKAFEQGVYDDCDADCRATVHNFMVGGLVLSLTLDLILIGLSSALIYGVNKKKAKFMTPFLWYIIVSIAFIVVVWILLIYALAELPVACLIITVTVGLIFALNFHFFTVIKGHQNEIIAEQGNVHIPLGEEEAGFDCPKDY